MDIPQAPKLILSPQTKEKMASLFPGYPTQEYWEITSASSPFPMFFSIRTLPPLGQTTAVSCLEKSFPIVLSAP